MCIAKDGQGRLYITDDYTHSVSVFDFDGNFIRRWGARGDGNGEFNGPSGIDTDSDGNIYIADTHNNRVQKFTSGGEFVLAFGSRGDGNGEFEMPWGITVAPGGDLYIADWGNDRIQRFSSAGEFVASYGRTGQAQTASCCARPDSRSMSAGTCMCPTGATSACRCLTRAARSCKACAARTGLSKWAANFLEVNQRRGRSARQVQP